MDTQKPKRFITATFSLYIFFLVLIYIFSTHYLHIPKELALPHNGTLDSSTIPAIFGAYALALALAIGFEWYKTKTKDKLLLVTFISPFFALSFIGATWLSLGKHFAYDGGVQRYLTVPQLGVSLFISAILVLILRKSHSRNIGSIFRLMIFASIILYLYIFSQKESQYFKTYSRLGANVVAQKHIQERVFNAVDYNRENIIVYFQYDLSTISTVDRYWYTALEWGVTPFWFYLRKYYENAGHKVNGCIGWVDTYVGLKNIFKYSNGQVTFDPATYFCTKDSIYDQQRKYTFHENDFFAFTFRGDQIFDITKETLDKLKKDYTSAM